MGYKYALEVAGAEVLVFREFGDYQGEWYAKVVYNGETGWINGSYGSCSGCDAWQAECEDYNDPLPYKWEYEDDKQEEYQAAYKEWKARDLERTRIFGLSYLRSFHSYDKLLADAVRSSEWDTDAEEVVQFLKDNK